jgi:riboflavin synthase
MFTGLIEAVGEVVEVKALPEGRRLRIAAPLASALAPGESIAVSGVCLTVVAADDEGFHADVSPETARVTTLGSIRRGALVNLERPLRVDARLGGHFVQGHVDATGTIEELRPQGDYRWLTVAFPPRLAPFIVHKGAIAVDGVSLTVAGADRRRFDVQIVPYTWEHTSLRAAKPGDPVNLECDILGKYVVRAVETAGWTTEENVR